MKEKILAYITKHGNVSYKEICLSVAMNCDASLSELVREKKIKMVCMCTSEPTDRSTYSDYHGYGIQGYCLKK